MVRFIIYLFETGLCLSLLYLAYWLFLRKETYFNFNRTFLTGSIVLALSVPLLHLNFIVPQGSRLEYPARGIVQFRKTYEELFRMTNADYGSEPGSRRDPDYGPEASGRRSTANLPVNEAKSGRFPPVAGYGRASGNGMSPEGRNPAARVILIIYITGVIYFFARFLYLVIRLCILAMRNGTTRDEGFRIVEIKEDISPFSFFRFLFINKRAFNESELKEVLAHERAHIRQKHSIDHLLAHSLAVFQWFNPFAWQIRNALKTTHEYIADRQVIEGGFEMFDYQSLLLSQVIGYHSVELVNNFNLKPIKKRIAMMTRKRSGIPARLKATLVIPVALALFLLFADFTLKGPGNRILRTGAGPDEQAMKESLTGLWERYKGMPGGGGHDVPGLLCITPERFSYIEGQDEVREYFWKSEQGSLILSTSRDGPGISLKIEYDGEDLTVWWNESKYQTYRKTGMDNTLDLVLSRIPVKIRPPVITQYRILERRLLTYHVSLGYTEDGSAELLLDGHPVKIEELGDRVGQYRSELNKLDQPLITGLLWVDRKMPMREVVRVKEELRKSNFLKIADGGYPHPSGPAVSPLLYSRIGLPRLLPPPDEKIIEKSRAEKEGIRIFTINLSARNTTPADVEKGLEDFIRQNEGGKYIFSLEYDGEIPYGQYIESVDMVFNVVYKFRKAMAMKKYQAPYELLGEDLQKEIRNTYPMVLSEAWNEI